jgi:phage terminase large subunit-like protein
VARRKAATSSGATGAHPRNYVDIALRYARDAAKPANRKHYCKWVRLAARRFIADLRRARGRKAPWRFDEWHANDACDFIEKLPHPEGVWDTETIVLHPSHVFLLVQLFGFRKRDGTRRFTTVLYSVARKNAKSTLAAGIALYCQLCEGENRPKVLSAATTGQQARMVFDYARSMVDQSPELREEFGVTAYRHSIHSAINGGQYIPINAKASTQDGRNPSAAVLDELHAHKSYDLLNVLRSSAGARRNPLYLYTTTEGYINGGPWPEQRKYGQQVLEGVLEADHFLALLYTLDVKDKHDPTSREDDPLDPKVWVKANPLIDVNPLLLTELQKMAADARAMPGTMSEFRIKRCNLPAMKADSWVNIVKWKRCARPVDLDKMVGLPCWGGMDLASNTDIAALRLLWLDEETQDYYTWGLRWVPEEAVAWRTERGTVPYAGWVAGGYLQQTEGDVTSYVVIEQAIKDLVAKFNVRLIAYDPWNATQLVQRLQPEGIPLLEFRQGPKTYHPAMSLFERTYVAAKLAHADDPILTWCASNLVVRKGENDEMAPSKKRSADKIDDICALVMAFGASMSEVQEGDMEGFLNNPLRTTRH